jgi:hypothetical protein
LRYVLRKEKVWLMWVVAMVTRCDSLRKEQKLTDVKDERCHRLKKREKYRSDSAMKKV